MEKLVPQPTPSYAEVIWVSMAHSVLGLSNVAIRPDVAAQENLTPGSSDDFHPPSQFTKLICTKCAYALEQDRFSRANPRLDVRQLPTTIHIATRA
ncbi:unnamed protein product [Caretta caretta]